MFDLTAPFFFVSSFFFFFHLAMMAAGLRGGECSAGTKKEHDGWLYTYIEDRARAT